MVALIEPQKTGDWFSGAGSEAMYAINDLYIKDFRAVGADPYIGKGLRRLLAECGALAGKPIPMDRAP